MTAASYCFSCERVFVGIGRFCSQRCRDWYDAGGGPLAVEVVYTWRDGRTVMPKGANGFLIAGASCGTSFDSKGLRCCSAECERQYRDHQDHRAALAEVASEPTAKSLCAECGRPIPTWRDGRRVRKGARFCSKTCAQKARRGGQSEADNGSRLGSCPPPRFEADNDEKVPVKRAPKSGVGISSVGAEGGS